MVGGNLLDLKQMLYFKTIAEEGQITSAAKKLHIAQPPLSYQLKTLEEEIGVKLIERGSRGVKLTEAGKLFYNRVEQILKLSDASLKEMKDFKDGDQGSIYMGTVSSSGTSLFLDKLIKFHKKYPLVNFEVFEGNTFKVLEMLESGLIEIGIVRTPFNTTNLNCLTLKYEPMIAAMRRDFDWNSSSNLTSISELANKPLIIYRRFESLFNESFKKNSLKPEILCKNDDARTTLQWAEAGVGIALVPKSSLSLVGSSHLIYKEINDETLITSICAIWVKDRFVSSPAKNFLELFCETKK
jgi:DNA-binding transcriptional LysR family regulator